MLFSTPMVQAIIAGNKTQTRRVLSTQPDDSCYYQLSIKDGILEIDYNAGDDNPKLKCPYGKPGDILWVREMLYQEGELGLKYVAGNEWIDNDTIPENHNAYRNYSHCNIPSIHMPKWASRIWLQIESTRIERLNDISEEDAIDEGIEPDPTGLSIDIVNGHEVEVMNYRNYSKTGYRYIKPIDSYRTLWDSINAKPTNKQPTTNNDWNSNPWVWVITFKVLSTTGRPESLPGVKPHSKTIVA